MTDLYDGQPDDAERRLYLVRHAKSDWDGYPRVPDHDRPLNARGRSAAQHMGKALAHMGIEPDLVVSSSALRTKQTLERLEAAAGHTWPSTLESALYAAHWDTLYSFIQDIEVYKGNFLGSEPRRLMLIGHNPGLHDLALHLASAEADKLRLVSQDGAADMHTRLSLKLPTCGVLVFRLSGRFADLHPSRMQLVQFLTPKRLAEH